MTGFCLRAGARAVLLTGCLVAPEARGQSTDGYHSIQIIPVVVDTASFTQRFHFRKYLAAITTIEPIFYPARGTSHSGPLTCPAFNIPTLERTFSSLRELCPGLPDGPQFGYLRLTQTGPVIRTFSGYSRVSNSAGAGFSVEAFPAHTFTKAFASVSGIRRLRATNGAPAYQTNCFISRMYEVPQISSNEALKVFYGVGDSEGNQIGSSKVVDLLPGEMVRVLDVFSAVGAPDEDFNDANFRISPDVFSSIFANGAVMSFCTVQDNTSLGADFRIAKTEFGVCGAESCSEWMNPMDEHVNRDSQVGRDVRLPGEAAGRIFSLAVGAAQNSHVYYFRRPDYVSCELIEPQTGQRSTYNYGLEMRMAGPDGTVIAGGNRTTGFNRMYLGDKGGSSNTRYVIQVERNDIVPLEPAERPYSIHCQSGSGHTPGDTVRFNAPINQF